MTGAEQARRGLPHMSRRTGWMLALAFALALLLAWAGLRWGDGLWRLLTDEPALEAAIERAGVWGPLALVALGAVQVVVAPIPGYAVGLAAGYLYGPALGGLYATVGMLLGGMAAMWLGRTLGRPAVQWMIGAQKLARWESVTHSSSPLVWFFLLLGPVGDTPFWIAGLSAVRYLVILLLALFIRGPFVFLSTAIGSGALSPAWIGLSLAIGAAAMMLFYRYRSPLTAWYERMLHAHLPHDAAAPLLPAPVEAREEE